MHQSIFFSRLRCTPADGLTLDSIIAKLIAFELSNFDNYSPASVETIFKVQLTPDESKKKKKRKHVSRNSGSNDDLDELEALLVKRLPRGKGKQKGKLIILCFTYKKVGHIAARFPNRDDKDDRKNFKYKARRDDRRNKDKRGYKHKGKKSCYVSKEYGFGSNFDDHDKEVFF